MRRACLQRVLSAALALGLTARAHAHAPLPRGVALDAAGGAVAVALPGFGLVHRPDANTPFHYVCDALLFSRLSIEQPAMLFHADGSLLVASTGGMRTLAPDGCPLPSESELREAAVIALAAQPGATHNVYAVVAGELAGVWQSSDGGQHWQMRAQLATPELVTGLAVSADDGERLYLSQEALPGSIVRVSVDGGRTIVSHAQEVARTLLAVEAGATPYLWARARDAQTVGNRGWAILRASEPQGPWQTMTRVAYYGGFALGAEGVITVGDELGGVVQSRDHGASFVVLGDEVPVTDLAQAGDTLWASTSGLPNDPALQAMPTAEPFAPVVALDTVDGLVRCADDLQVQRVCASAWAEWERDVLMRPVTLPDAGIDMEQPRDAGLATDAAEPATGADASEPSAPRRANDGCSVQSGASSHGAPCALLALLGLARLQTRRRRR